MEDVIFYEDRSEASVGVVDGEKVDSSNKFILYYSWFLASRSCLTSVCLFF